MKSRWLFGRPATERRTSFPLALASMALATVLVGSGCSSNGGNDSAQVASAMASNVTMTAVQRQHIHLYTVAPSTFSKAIETTGMVDFDWFRLATG